MNMIKSILYPLTQGLWCGVVPLVIQRYHQHGGAI